MKIDMNALSALERRFTYRVETDIEKAAGLIGHLRGYFTDGSKFFWSDWTPHVWDLDKNDDVFKENFCSVVDACRFDAEQEGMLKDFISLKNFCKHHREFEAQGNYCSEYYFRVENGDYVYLFRLNPTKGDNQLYIHCYLKDMFNAYLQSQEVAE